MALSADRELDFKLKTNALGHTVELPVAASTRVYKGGLVGLNVSGYLKPLAGVTVATALTGGDRFVGVADDAVDNSSGSDGDKNCTVITSGAFEHTLTGVAVTDVGAPVYASADGTLTKVALGNAFVGWVERYVSANKALIRIASQFGTGPMFNRWSPSIETAAANIALLIHPSENHNGLLVLWAGAMVTETFAGGTEDQGIITLQDTDGTTVGVTFTAANAGADAVDDIIAPAANSVAIGATSGSALVMVPAGKGLQAKVTQLTSGAGEQGAMKVGVIAMPIA